MDTRANYDDVLNGRLLESELQIAGFLKMANVFKHSFDSALRWFHRGPFFAVFHDFTECHGSSCFGPDLFSYITRTRD